MQSLVQTNFISGNTVRELLVLVPASQYSVLSASLEGLTKHFPFNTSVLIENELFGNFGSKPLHPYGVQMAVKLLASKLVSTSFYMTLDADVLLMHNFNLSEILLRQIPHPNEEFLSPRHPRALYEHENRFLHHPAWWTSSEAFLEINSLALGIDQGFSVTPV
jgi:hypothetical protein